MELTHWCPINYYCTRTIATCNTLLFFNFKILAPADPIQGLLEQPDRQVTARRFGLPFPAYGTALDVPIDIFLIPFQADTLVGKVVKQGRKGFTAIFEFRLQRQQAESQVCQAKFWAELTQTILETGAPYPHCQTAASPRSISTFESNL
jgi:hypothetical protein